MRIRLTNWLLAGLPLVAGPAAFVPAAAAAPAAAPAPSPQGTPAATPPGPTSPRPGTGAGPPPPYTPVRWNEDYSYLKDPDKRTDFFDPIKYIPLNDKGDVYLSLGGSVRERYEYFENFLFGLGPQDENGFYLTRFMGHADLHVGPHLRGFVQFISALEDGRDPEPRPIDEDDFDIHQAFLDFRLPLGGEGTKNAVTLRGGRQNLAYGAQRLIGVGDWANVRRTFDGGKGSLAFGDHALDAFVVRPLIIEEEEWNDGDDDITFWGLYDTWSLPRVLPGATTKLDLYALGLHMRERAARPGAVPPIPGIAVDSDTYTIGARFSATPKPWDFDVEAAYQFGEFGTGDVSAWMFAVEGGYTFDPVMFKPRVYLGFDIASGDDDPADPDKQTFNQLFPSPHPYFGYIDAIGRQNVVDLHPGAELTLLAEKPWVKKLSLRADYHLFWRQSDDDAVYNALGGVLRADGGSDEKSIGSEVDLLLNWQIDRHWAAYAGYSHFFAGDFIQETGPSEDTDFLYLGLQLTF